MKFNVDQQAAQASPCLSTRAPQPMQRGGNARSRMASPHRRVLAAYASVHMMSHKCRWPYVRPAPIFPVMDNIDNMNVFDRALVRRRRERAVAAGEAHDFLFAEVAARLADRLTEVTRRFPAALDLG